MLAITAAGFVLSMLGFFLLRDYIIEQSKESSALFVQYFNYLLPLILFTLLFMILDSYYKTLHNAVKGIMLKEFIQRLLFLAFIVFFYLGYLNFSQYVLFYVVSICIPTVVLVISLIKDGEFILKPDFKFLNKDLNRLILRVGFYGILIGFSGMVITNLDRIMVERFVGLGATGVYTTTAYFATLIIMPSRALLKISDPIISQSWKNNDLKHLLFIYERTSLTQLVIGSLLFIGIWANEGNVFRILPASYMEGRWVIFFLGLAFMFDMISGAAAMILANSKFFKYQAYFMLLLIVLVVISNIIFIPMYGITGAAFATCLSKLITDLGLFLFLRIKYKLQPYSLRHLWIILIAAVAYIAGYIIPEIHNLYLDIFIRSSVITIIFVVLMLRTRMLLELNEKYEWAIDKFIRPIFKK